MAHIISKTAKDNEEVGVFQVKILSSKSVNRKLTPLRF